MAVTRDFRRIKQQGNTRATQRGLGAGPAAPRAMVSDGNTPGVAKPNTHAMGDAIQGLAANVANNQARWDAGGRRDDATGVWTYPSGVTTGPNDPVPPPAPVPNPHFIGKETATGGRYIAVPSSRPGWYNQYDEQGRTWGIIYGGELREKGYSPAPGYQEFDPQRSAREPWPPQPVQQPAQQPAQLPPPPPPLSGEPAVQTPQPVRKYGGRIVPPGVRIPLNHQAMLEQPPEDVMEFTGGIPSSVRFAGGIPPVEPQQIQADQQPSAIVPRVAAPQEPPVPGAFYSPQMQQADSGAGPVVSSANEFTVPRDPQPRYRPSVTGNAGSPNFGLYPARYNHGSGDPYRMAGVRVVGSTAARPEEPSVMSRLGTASSGLLDRIITDPRVRRGEFSFNITDPNIISPAPQSNGTPSTIWQMIAPYVGDLADASITDPNVRGYFPAGHPPPVQPPPVLQQQPVAQPQPPVAPMYPDMSIAGPPPWDSHIMPQLEEPNVRNAMPTPWTPPQPQPQPQPQQAIQPERRGTEVDFASIFGPRYNAPQVTYDDGYIQPEFTPEQQARLDRMRQWIADARARLAETQGRRPAPKAPWQPTVPQTYEEAFAVPDPLNPDETYVPRPYTASPVARGATEVVNPPPGALVSQPDLYATGQGVAADKRARANMAASAAAATQAATERAEQEAQRQRAGELLAAAPTGPVMSDSPSTPDAWEQFKAASKANRDAVAAGEPAGVVPVWRGTAHGVPPTMTSDEAIASQRERRAERRNEKAERQLNVRAKSRGVSPALLAATEKLQRGEELTADERAVVYTPETLRAQSEEARLAQAQKNADEDRALERERMDAESQAADRQAKVKQADSLYASADAIQGTAIAMMTTAPEGETSQERERRLSAAKNQLEQANAMRAQADALLQPEPAGSPPAATPPATMSAAPAGSPPATTSAAPAGSPTALKVPSIPARTATIKRLGMTADHAALILDPDDRAAYLSAVEAGDHDTAFEIGERYGIDRWDTSFIITNRPKEPLGVMPAIGRALGTIPPPYVGPSYSVPGI